MSVSTSIPSSSTSASQLCSSCGAIFQHWKKFLQDQDYVLPHSGCPALLKAAADQGCSLCTQFMHSYKIQRAMDAETQEDAMSLINSEVDTECLLRSVETWQDDPSSGEDCGYTTGRYVDNVICTKHYTGTVSMEASRMETSGQERVLYLYWPWAGPSRAARVELVPSDDSFDRIEGLPTDAGNTKSSLAVCKQWLEQCMGDHELCVTSKPRFSPTRLISLSDGMRRLVTIDFQEEIIYATLSHCWGTATFTVLTKATFQDFHDSIPTDALSKTFLDAILVCEELGVDYIWIDSLCIIQDSSEDWTKEAAMMTHVYGNSHINIAASGAANGHDGLFFGRSAVWRCRIKINLSESDNMLYNCVPSSMYVGSIIWEPLSTRGWTLQEKLLPRRNLSFTRTQVFWECRENFACEAFPTKIPSEISYKSILGEAGQFQTSLHDVNWTNIIEQYSSRVLTYSSDKLVAISGLARELQSISGDEYCAGLWRQKLDSQLCWLSVGQSKPRSCSEDDTSPIIPSWSWASTDMSIRYNFNEGPATTTRLLLKNLEFIADPEEDSFGASSTAGLLLGFESFWTGKVDFSGENAQRKLIHCKIEIAGRTLKSKESSFSVSDDIVKQEDIYFLPVIQFTDQFLRTRLSCLILQRSETGKGHFKRIGMLDICYFNFGTEDECVEMEEQISAFDAEAQVDDDLCSRILRDESGSVQRFITLV